ncbi:MAG: hypothetical protein FD143_3777, partial [Ignavibacteria bacterium]
KDFPIWLASNPQSYNDLMIGFDNITGEIIDKFLNVELNLYILFEQFQNIYLHSY